MKPHLELRFRRNGDARVRLNSGSGSSLTAGKRTKMPSVSAPAQAELDGTCDRQDVWRLEKRLRHHLIGDAGRSPRRDPRCSQGHAREDPACSVHDLSHRLASFSRIFGFTGARTISLAIGPR